MYTSVISQMIGWKSKTSQVSYGNRIESWNEPDIGNKMLQSNAHSISIIAHPAPTSPLLTTFSFSVMPMTQTTQSYRNYAGESHSILRNFNDETPSLFADDIITPVYVAPTRSPTTFRPKHHKENIQERPSCDDEEDCEEGSGEPVTTEEIFVTSTTGPFYLIFYF